MKLSNEPEANMCSFSGEGERLVTKPSWPRRIEVVIVLVRGSWRRIVRDVVPSARREREGREVDERRGAENGVEVTGCEEGDRRS